MRLSKIITGIVISIASGTAGSYAYGTLWVCAWTAIGGRGASSNCGNGATAVLYFSAIAFLFGVGMTIAGLFQKKQHYYDSPAIDGGGEETAIVGIIPPPLMHKPFDTSAPPERSRRHIEKESHPIS